MRIPFIVAMLVVAFTVFEVSAQSTETTRKVPEEKQTSLGLYVTAKEAFDKWKAEPEKVKVIDVRTPEEYIFVGHPEMAWNIPLLFMTHQWDEKNNQYATKLNREFVAQVKELAEPKDTILLMCRSGDRSAMAVDMLAKAGFTNAYTIIHGMEGDTVADQGNLYRGKRMKNGWKNSGLPWTYEANRTRMWFPKEEKP